MRNLKRALSLLLSSTMVLGMMVMGGSAAGYKDVNEKNHKEAIEVLQAVGIMTGDENGNFNPEKGVTRNEMAVIMSNLMAYNVATYSGTSPFTDVPSWAEPYVAACWTNGITAGTSDTTYGGDQTVTTAQAALMIMKALGYFQYSSDFGSDWQLSTVSQGNKIDLFTDVNSGVKEAMTRNDVAQLVLNGLESGTVEAESNGSITVGDTTIVSGVKYNYITSGQSYAKAINSALNTNNDASTSTGSIVELGEKLYQGDLMKKGGSDDFGRPAATWSYNNKEIGTYANEADYTYTKSISEKDLYNELGATAMGYTWTVYYNGEILTIDKPSKNVTDTYSKTATGTLTEVFVDNVAKTVTVTMVDTFLAEVVRVQENANDVTVTLNYLSAPTNNTSRTATVTLDSTDLAVDDKVLVTTYEDGNQFSVASIVKAETVTGTVTAVKARYTDGTGKYAVMDSNQYDYVGNTFANDLADTALNDPTINAENTLYLDTYGNMIAFEATKRNVDYVYLDDAINALGGINALATFADGTSATIYVDEVDGQKKPTVNDMKPETAGNQAYADGIYAYEKQGDAYQLITLSDRNAAANSWTNLPGFDTSRNVGDVDNGASGTAVGAHYMFYSIKSGTNAIQAVTKNALVNGATVDTKNVVSLTGSTIFVDVEGGKIYTGYANVPTMNDITFFVVYNRQLNADVVFITDGADNSTSDSFFYVTDAKPVTTKVDGTYYYEYPVMMNNEKTTITFKGTNRDVNNNAIAKDVLYKIETITPDGHVKSASPVTGFSLGYSSSVNVATYADGGTLRLIRGANADIAGTGSNNLDNNTGESIYTYNKDTQFVYIDTKLDGTNTVSKSVGVGSANMINTTKDKLAGNNNVYVVAVDDKDARTPVATLVYIVEPVDNAQDNQRPTGTDSFTNGKFTFYIDKAAYATSPYAFVNGSNQLTFRFTANMGGAAGANYTFDYEVKGGNAVIASGTTTQTAVGSVITVPAALCGNFFTADQEYTIEITNVKVNNYAVSVSSDVSGVTATGSTSLLTAGGVLNLGLTGVSVNDHANVIFSVTNVKDVTVAGNVTDLGNGRYQINNASVSGGVIASAAVFNSVKPDETGAIAVTVESITDASANVQVEYVLAAGSEKYASLSATTGTVAVGDTIIAKAYQPTLTFKNNVTTADVTISGATDANANTGVVTGDKISADDTTGEDLTIPAATAGNKITVTVTVIPTKITIPSASLVVTGDQSAAANDLVLTKDTDGKWKNDAWTIVGSGETNAAIVTIGGKNYGADVSSGALTLAAKSVAIDEATLLAVNGSSTFLPVAVTDATKFTYTPVTTAAIIGSSKGQYIWSVEATSGTYATGTNCVYLANTAVATFSIRLMDKTSLTGTDTVSLTAAGHTPGSNVTFTAADAVGTAKTITLAAGSVSADVSASIGCINA